MSSEWVAWVEVEDKDTSFSVQRARREAGEDVVRVRLYLQHTSPYFKLTRSRALAARYDTEDTAWNVAEMAANPETPFGAEEIPAKTGGLRSRGS